MSNKGKQGKKGTKIVNCESITLVTKESTTTISKDGVNTINHYPFKESILGMIPEGVSIDESYMIDIADSMDLDVSDIINQWYSALSQNNDVVNNLKDTIKGYQEENEKLAKDYNELRESYDRAVKECVELNDTRKKLKDDIELLGGYFEDLQEDRNKLYQKTINNEITEEYVKGIEKANSDLHKQLQENNKKYNNIANENEELKNTILKLQEDLKESNNEVNHLKGKTEYMEGQFKLNYNSLECAKTEIKSRIDDTEDLKYVIRVIARHL